MTWTKGEVLLDWLCSSPGHLVLLLPIAGQGPRSIGGDGAAALLSLHHYQTWTSHPARYRHPLRTWPPHSAVSSFGCWVSHLP